MTELDLSLLTDEERVLWDFCSSRPKEQAVIIPAEMLDVLTALIAARAENKRKDEMLAKAEEALIWASGAFQSEEESAAWAAYGRSIVDEIRAHLQPKKEGE